MRQGEVLGLTWDCVDFENCTLYVNKQLQKSQKVGGTYVLVPTKNSKGRIVTVAEAVMDMLREEKEWQELFSAKSGRFSPKIEKSRTPSYGTL